MEIRTYHETDRANVIQLWDACELTRPWNNPNNDIDRKVRFQPELFFVGTHNSDIIASAMAGYDGHRGSVFYLAVHPDAQNKNLGKQMMTHIETTLKSLGCPKINIVIRSTNLPVLKFYDTLSYSLDDVVSVGKRLIPDR